MSVHLHSCLTCFRLATELRDLKSLSRLVRAQHLTDPGPAFWNHLPQNVADAWESSRLARRGAGGGKTRGGADSPGVFAPSTWLLGHLVRRLWRPLPAAFAGATLAIVLVSVLGKLPGRGTVLPTPPPVVSGAATSGGSSRPSLESGEGEEEGNFSSSPSPTDELEAMGVDDLRALAKALNRVGRI